MIPYSVLYYKVLFEIQSEMNLIKLNQMTIVVTPLKYFPVGKKYWHRKNFFTSKHFFISSIASTLYSHGKYLCYDI